MAKKEQATPKDSLLVTASKSLGTAAGKLAAAIGFTAKVETKVIKTVKKKVASRKAKKVVAPRSARKTTRKVAK
jgi:hypothetical protein